MPLVSILIPTYNQPEFFRQALESALNQDYPNIEILVSDDSTDDRVKKVAMEYKDRIQFFKHPKIEDGTLGWRNMMFLLNHAHGEFINFLFHDDLFMPQKISTMMKYFNNDVAFVTSVRYIIDSENNVIRKAGITDMVERELLVPAETVAQKMLESCTNFVGELSSVLFRREDLWCEQNSRYEICRFMNLSKMIANCDIPTYLEICRQNPDKKCIFINECLSSFRLSIGQNIQNFNISLDTLFEWISMIGIAYKSRTFITNEEQLVTCFGSFMQLAMNVTSKFAGFNGLDEKHARDIDSLIQILNACERNDIDMFLKLSNGRYVE
ncbi:MAG: glycosyltransferase family 2 protein [Selenomonadaceae bacterium]|nr:glycosyltransferase family 2 protein [Selenomonadaceae bacterium]